MNCWEFFKCGREAGGIHTRRLGMCPAYPNDGMNCARIHGTFCKGEIQGTFPQKLPNCMKCDYYKSEHYDKYFGSAQKFSQFVTQIQEG